VRAHCRSMLDDARARATFYARARGSTSTRHPKPAVSAITTDNAPSDQTTNPTGASLIRGSMGSEPPRASVAAGECHDRPRRRDVGPVVQGCEATPVQPQVRRSARIHAAQVGSKGPAWCSTRSDSDRWNHVHESRGVGPLLRGALSRRVQCSAIRAATQEQSNAAGAARCWADGASARSQTETHGQR